MTRRELMLTIGLLAASSSAAAQSRVYTNADLGRPLDRIETVTAEQLAGLAAHQFTVPPERTGPAAIIIASDPTDGPFGPFNTSGPMPLDPTYMSPYLYGFGAPVYSRPPFERGHGPKASAGLMRPAAGPRQAPIGAGRSPSSRGVRVRR